MPVTLQELGLDRLSREERFELVGLLRDSLAPHATSVLSQPRRDELARRVAEDDANPDDTVGWDEARTATLGRLGS